MHDRSMAVDDARGADPPELVEPGEAGRRPRADQPEKRVTWGELFFDLVFVFAVTQLSALLHGDHTWAGVGRALIVFVPVYWAWVGTTVHANTHDVDRPLERVGIFTVGLCSLFMSLGIPGAYGDRAVLFAVAYLALRLVLLVLVTPGRGLFLNPFTVAAFGTGPARVVGALLGGSAQLWLWSLAALADLSTPLVARARVRLLNYEPNHLPERFGLFVIIALGESIVAIGTPAAASPHLGAAEVIAVAVAFVIACGLWWVYYQFAASAIRHGVETATVRADIVRQVLSYGHLPLVGGVIAVAVGLAEAVAHPGHQLGNGYAGLLYGGAAIYLGTFGYTRWRMFGKVSTHRLTAGVVSLALSPLAAHLPGLAALALLAALLVGLNGFEYWRVTRTGGI
jgi:low temperature requirement protein LtrA